MGVGFIKKIRSLKRLSELIIFVCKWDLLYMLLCMIGFINFFSWCYIEFFLFNYLDKKLRKRKRKLRNLIKRSKRRKKKVLKFYVGVRWRKLWRRRKGGINEIVVNYFIYFIIKMMRIFLKSVLFFYIYNFFVLIVFFI